MRIFEPFGVHRLEGAADSSVERLTAGGQQALVGDLLGERVLEDVHRLGRSAQLVQELEAPQLAERGLERASVAPHGSQQPRRDLAAEDGGGLEEALGVLRQPVDARHEDFLDRGRDRPDVAQLRVVEQGSAQLLDEEGITFRLVENRPRHRLRCSRLAKDGTRHRQAIFWREWAQRDLRRVGLVDPCDAIAGPIGRDEEDRQAGQTFSQRAQVLLRGCVDPVQVLNREDQWPDAAGADRHLPECLERPLLEGVSGEHLQALRSLLDAEQVKHVRRGLRNVHAQLVQRGAYLAGDRLRGVGVGDAAVRPHDFQDRQVRDGATPRQAAPFEVGDGAAGKPLPELVQEAGFAHPRFPDEPDKLPVPPLGLDQKVAEHRQLALTADELAERARCASGDRAGRADGDQPVRTHGLRFALDLEGPEVLDGDDVAHCPPGRFAQKDRARCASLL